MSIFLQTGAIKHFRARLIKCAGWSFILFVLLPLNLKAQEKVDSIQSQHTLIPLIFYLPETSLGIGGTGISTFQDLRHHPKTRPSQILYSAVYTFKNQLLLFIPFELYGNANNSRIKGELGYYRYFYNFHGIGPESSKNDLESYSVNFPRIEVNYSHRVFSNFYLGAGMNFDQFAIQKIEEGGILQSLKPIGYQGGRKANFVALAFFDTRDTLFAPSHGHYFEMKFQGSLPHWISDFQYYRLDLDYRHYQKLSAKMLLASNLFWSWASSNTPFFDLPYISTPNRGRGFDDRRFMNYDLINLQSELRFPIYKRFRGAGFLSISDLAHESFQYFQNKLEWSYGMGIRYQLRNDSKARLRLDLAKSRDSFNIYFTLNEAF